MMTKAAETTLLIEAEREELDRDLFIDHWLSATPRTHRLGVGGPYTFWLHGYVLGRHLRVESIDLLQAQTTEFSGGLPIRTIPLGPLRIGIGQALPDVPHKRRCGIHANISSLALPPHFNINVRANFEDGTHRKIASLRGTRSRLRSRFDPLLQPLLVTRLGRSGSTLLMRLLAAHPEIAVHHPRTTEPRVACYWASILTALAEPAAYLRQIAPHNSLGGQWWLGRARRATPMIKINGPLNGSVRMASKPSQHFVKAESTASTRKLHLEAASCKPLFFREVSAGNRPSETPSLGNPTPLLLSEIYRDS